jgi:methylmalonyl-CoA mutase C-terminal domain/subunit
VLHDLQDLIPNSGFQQIERLYIATERPDPDLPEWGRQMSSSKKIRVIVAKPGLDGHDRGAKVVARALRDAGMEVIYTGLRQTPEMIVRAAIDENANVIGLSILSGAHMAIFPRIMELLKEEEAEDILVVAGGIIPEDDIPELKKAGIAEVFGPGTTLDTIVDYIKDNVKV